MDRFYDKIEISILNFKRAPVPKPRPFIEPPALIVEEKIKPPSPPKPKAATNVTWHLAEQDAAVLKTETRKQDRANHTSEIGNGLSHSDTVSRKPTYTPDNLLSVNALTQPIAAQPKAAKADYVAPQGETRQIALEAEDGLNNSGCLSGS